jgi:hypothetical protein
MVRSIANSFMLLGTTGGAPPVQRRAVPDPSWFSHQVDFGTEYTVRPTPMNFTSGTSAFTQTSYGWQPIGQGAASANLAVDPGASWVLDWVFNPANFGFTATDVARLRAHEQIHYDLPALALREFVNTAQGFSGDLQRLFNTITGNISPLDNVYESSTGTLFTSPVQDLWTQEISDLKGRPDGTLTELMTWAQQRFPGFFAIAAKQRLPARFRVSRPR